MNEITLCIFTMLGMIFCIPFLFTVIANPDSFGNHETWSLIFLGMVSCGLPITVFGWIQIMKIISFDEEKSNKELREA